MVYAPLLGSPGLSSNNTIKNSKRPMVFTSDNIYGLESTSGYWNDWDMWVGDNWNWRLESLEPLNGIKDKLLKLNKDTKRI